MGKDLKSSWKKTGKQLGGAFKSLGISLAKTGKTVVNKIDSALDNIDKYDDTEKTDEDNKEGNEKTDN